MYKYKLNSILYLTFSTFRLQQWIIREQYPTLYFLLFINVIIARKKLIFPQAHGPNSRRSRIRSWCNNITHIHIYVIAWECSDFLRIGRRRGGGTRTHKYHAVICGILNVVRYYGFCRKEQKQFFGFYVQR